MTKLFKSAPVPRRIGKIVGRPFLRAATSLAGGTAVAQALTVIALPVLTRLYSPEDFSLLAIYVSVLTVVSVVACLRLEIAIPLPENDSEAANLLATALCIAAGVAAMSGFAILLFGVSLFNLAERPEMALLGWLLPLGVWLAGSYAALQYWATRKRRFNTVAATRVTQSASGLTVQLGLGLFGAGPVGLLVGHALIAGSGGLTLAVQTLRKDLSVIKAISAGGMWDAFVHFRRFPQFSVWEGLATNASIMLPVLLIAAFSTGPEAGFLMLSLRILYAPLQLIGNSVSQVYFSHAVEKWRNGDLHRFTRKVALYMFLCVSVPVTILTAICVPFFGSIFGSGWERAGEISMMLLPMFALRLISTPISMVMNVVGRQKSLMIYQLSAFFIINSSVIICLKFAPEFSVAALSISSFFVYLLLILILIRSSAAPYVQQGRAGFEPLDG